jgi:hypothetical protein
LLRGVGPLVTSRSRRGRIDRTRPVDQWTTGDRDSAVQPDKCAMSPPALTSQGLIKEANPRRGDEIQRSTSRDTVALIRWHTSDLPSPGLQVQRIEDLDWRYDSSRHSFLLSTGWRYHVLFFSILHNCILRLDEKTACLPLFLNAKGQVNVRTFGPRSVFGRCSPRARACSVTYALLAQVVCHSNDSRPTHVVRSHMGPHRPNITGIEKRRRHRGKTAEDDERDTIPDLLLKYSDTCNIRMKTD